MSDFISLSRVCGAAAQFYLKKSNTGENISQDKPEGDPLRNMRPPPTL